MRLDDLPSSENVEDRRSEGSRYGPGGFGMPGARGGLGIGTIVVLGLIGWALGIDPRLLIGGAEILSGGGSSYEQPYPGSERGGVPGSQTARTGAPSDQMGRFVSLVLGSTEVQWKEIFTQSGKRYEPPTLVMFSGATRSACGFAQSAMGPFYCPNDQKVYLDTSFFQDLERRFHACDIASKTCQFSEAYVIAHEVGHHVQNLLGILPKARQLQQGLDKAQANHLQVQVELQADCLAGVWAFHAEEKWRFMEAGDVESALKTASAIGDDRLQKQATGYVVPDAFTHGSSEQRTRWFTTGLKSGSLASCDTFSAAHL
jgi:predicted metalloprotease